MSYIQQGKHSVSPGIDPSDGLLLRQSLTGDEGAFESLVSRYHTPLLHYIQHILKDEEQAYDVLQFVFFRLYLSQPTLLTHGSLKAWLFHVARNRCVDEWRKRRCRPSIHFSELSEEGISLIESIQDLGPLPEEIVEQRDLHASLQEAIRGLPSRFRGVVHLRCFGHLTFSEIGHTLKIPENTAKTYYSRALPLLRSALSNSTSAALTL